MASYNICSLSLAYFPLLNVFMVHLCCSTFQDLFSFFRRIVSCVYLSVHERLCYFHLLAILYNAVMNVDIQLFESLFSVLWDIDPEVELLCHIVPCLTFSGTSILFFHSSCTILQSHQTVHQGSDFSTSSPVPDKFS